MISQRSCTNSCLPQWAWSAAPSDLTLSILHGHAISTIEQSSVVISCNHWGKYSIRHRKQALCCWGRFKSHLVNVVCSLLCYTVQAADCEDTAFAAPDLMGLLDTPSAAVNHSAAVSPASGFQPYSSSLLQDRPELCREKQVAQRCNAISCECCMKSNIRHVRLWHPPACLRSNNSKFA